MSTHAFVYRNICAVVFSCLMIKNVRVEMNRHVIESRNHFKSVIHINNGKVIF